MAWSKIEVGLLLQLVVLLENVLFLVVEQLEDGAKILDLAKNVKKLGEVERLLIEPVGVDAFVDDSLTDVFAWL